MLSDIPDPLLTGDVADTEPPGKAAVPVEMIEDDVGIPVSPTTGEGVFLGGRLSEGLGWGCSCGGAPGYGDAPGTGGMIEAVEE